MRDQAGTWIACLVLVALVAMAAKGEEPIDFREIFVNPPPPAWHQMPLAEPGTYQSRLSLVDPISIELRRGGSEYRITNEPAGVGRVEIRERFGELIGVRAGIGCRVEVVDHDRKAAK